MKRLVSFILVVCIALIAMLASAEAITEFKYIDGVKCRERQNILTYLFIGIDDVGPIKARDAEKGETAGQSDVIMLLVIDKAADTYAVINIDRNTIADVHSISDYDGKDLGVYPIQIALAHANGTGLEDSCENVKTAVSDLLLGIRIDHYFAANMDVVRILNNAVGGVEVTLEDDFSTMDPEMTLGKTLRLTDDQALTFVRGRRQVGNGTNEERMSRQKQFLEKLEPMIMSKYRENVSFPLDLVHSMDDYSVTDMTDKDFSYIAKALEKNQYLGMFEPTGETSIDRNGWAAFNPDPKSITEIIAQLYYKVVEE